MIRAFFGHLKTVIKHKFWVFYYAYKCGIPFRGLVHDLSKFHPVEFFESVKYYTGTKSPIDECKRINGYSKAWMHHKGHNKHHYEYWQDNFDNGGVPLCMPYKETLEMLCDYLGAGRAYNGKDFTFQKEYGWWKTKVAKPLAMHEVQKMFFELVFRSMSETNNLCCKCMLETTYKMCKANYEYKKELEK